MELLEAAKNGDFTAVFSLLQQGNKPDSRDHDNATPLYWGACHGYASLCEVLLQAGSDVNARVKWGSTPLHAASDRGHTECVIILIENGADVNCQNNRGDTALHIAAYRGNLDISRELLRANTDKNLQNDKGKTPQEEAVEGGHRDIAECIASFLRGNQGYAQAQRATRFTTPTVAPPVMSAVTNGTYDHSRYSNFGSGYTSSMTESACSSCDSYSDTGDYTESSTVSSVTDSAYVRNIPPILQRSISVGCHDISRHNNNHVTTRIPHPAMAKTNSVGHIVNSGYTNRNVYVNDVNKGCSSLDNVSYEDLRLFRASFTKCGEHESDYSTNITSNGRCIATESEDDSTAVIAENVLLRRDLTEMTSQRVNPNRRLCTSTGSVISPAKLSEGQESFIKTLQKQLVNAYKEIERLTTEKEDLKFKCSTVLNRLTDTEQQLADKTTECEHLRELLDTSRKQSAIVDTVETKGRQATKAMEKAGPSERTDSPVINITTESEDVKQLQTVIQKHVLKLTQRNLTTALIEPGNREWVPGVDYVIIGEKHSLWLQASNTSRVPLAIKFLIKHLKSGRRLILKMLLLLESPQSAQWDFTSVSLKCERKLPEMLLVHPNMARSVHIYEGLTDRFKKFVIAPDSKRVQLCNRTTFVVTDETKTFRTLLESINRNRDSKNRSVIEYGLFMEFMLQVTYQLLSLVCAFQESNVFHGSISEDSVIFDKTLIPQLSDIEINFHGSSPVCSPTHVLNGNTDPQPAENGNVLSGNKGYDDLISLCGLLRRTMFTEDHISYISACDQSLKQKLASVERVFQQVTSSPDESRTPAKSVLHTIGCVLFGPRKNTVRRERDCEMFIKTQVLQLTTQLKNYRSNGKLKFPLCRTCADTESRDVCNHVDNRRAFVGTWCTPEIQKALGKGYRLLKIYEVYHWDDSTQYDRDTGVGCLFAAYVNTFLKFKQEASGWPEWYRSQQDQTKYVRDYLVNEGVQLDPRNIAKNPELRALAKLCLNSFWGKFGQRLNQGVSQFFHQSEMDKFYKVLSDKSKRVTDYHVINEDSLHIEYEHQSGFVPEDMKTNIFLATFTTCWARLKLYGVLDLLGDRVLYYDTDSVIYVSRPGLFDPPLGDYLGELTDELDHGDYIEQFVSGGPKNYAYQTAKGKQTCKIRGFSLNHANGLSLNFGSVREMVGHVDPHHPTTYRKRALGDGEQPPSKVIVVSNPSKINRDKYAHLLYSREEKNSTVSCTTKGSF